MLRPRSAWQHGSRDDRLAESAPYKGPDLLTADIEPTSVACSTKYNRRKQKNIPFCPASTLLAVIRLTIHGFCSETSALGFLFLFIILISSLCFILQILHVWYDAQGLIAFSYRLLCYSAFWSFALSASLNHFRKTSLHFAEWKNALAFCFIRMKMQLFEIIYSSVWSTIFHTL